MFLWLVDLSKGNSHFQGATLKVLFTPGTELSYCEALLVLHGPKDVKSEVMQTTTYAFS